MGSLELTLEVEVSHVIQPEGGPGRRGSPQACRPLWIPCRVILLPRRGLQ